MSRDRLQKVLAQAGVASRRAAEQLITGGHVRVNGRIVTELGTRVDSYRDRIEVDGRKIVGEHPAYYLLNKPRETVTTLADPEGRPTVADLLRKIPERVFPVGRLDFHTSGALLLTNDGDMTQALLHPRKHVPKTYIAKVKGDLPLKALQALREGVVLDDGHKTAKSDTFVVNQERGNTWLQLTITEGKNRQIHRMLEALGYQVQRLARVTFAGLDVEGMRPGQIRQLTDSEVAKLKRDYLNPSRKEEANRKRAARWARAEAVSVGSESAEGPSAEADADASEQPTAVPPARKPLGQRPARPRPEKLRPPKPDRFGARDANTKPDRFPARGAKPDRFGTRDTSAKPDRLPARGPKPDRFSARDASAKPDRFPARGAKPDRFGTRDTSAKPDRFPARGAKPDRFPARGAKPDRFLARGAKPDRFPARGTKPDRFPARGTKPDRFPARGTKPDRFRKGAKPPEPLRDADQQPIRGADPKALRVRAAKTRTRLRRRSGTS